MLSFSVCVSRMKPDASQIRSNEFRDAVLWHRISSWGDRGRRLVVRTRDEALNLVRAMLADGIIAGQDITQFVPRSANPYDTEAVRQMWEEWYLSLGIEVVTGKPFRLAPCPFTEEEIAAADAAGELILCVPQGISRRELGELFRLQSWALTDPMVGDTTETEDFWFKTPKTAVPEYLNKSGTEVRRIFEDEHNLHFSLERYLVFVARYRYLTGQYPDFKYWLWLLRGRYDRSGVLIAGFDPFGALSIHGWLPRFQGSFVGARSIEIPDRLADAVHRETRKDGEEAGKALTEATPVSAALT